MADLQSNDNDAWTEYQAASNFVDGVLVGAQAYSDVRYYETTYGASEGFVYFVAIGDPYPTHVKIGFTRKNPQGRLRELQTGCPYKMRLLGFVFGTVGREQELHDVLRDDRAEGEWFVYSDYVSLIVKDQLSTEAF